jgi:simple sugar transport system permease protein
VTSVIVVLVCIMTQWLVETKLGQDFNSVGKSQYISKVSGIDVDRKRIIAVMMSTVLAAFGQIIYLQDMGTFNTYSSHEQIGMFSVAALLVGGASVAKANIGHAILGTILFNAKFIISPEIGQAVFGQVLLGEYFRTFMVYGVIGLALGIYVWKTNRQKSLLIIKEASDSVSGYASGNSQEVKN